MALLLRKYFWNLLILTSLGLLLGSPPLQAQNQDRRFSRDELDKAPYRLKTRKIFYSLDTLVPDTVFFYAAEILEDMANGKLSDEQSVDAYLVMGFTFNRLNAKYLGIQYTQEALKKYKSFGFAPSLYLIQLYGHLAGEMLNDRSNVRNSLKYYRKGYRLSEILGLDIQKASHLNNMGISYLRLGISDSAMYYFNRAMNTYQDEHHKFHPLELAIRNNMAQVKGKNGKYREALNLYMENLAIAAHPSKLDASDKTYRKVSASLGMASMYVKLLRFAEAKNSLATANHLVSDLPFHTVSKFITLSNLISIELAEKSGNNAALAQLSRKALATKDSLNDIKLEVSSKIMDALGNAQLEVADTRINTQKQELKNSQLYYGLLLAGLIIAVLGIVSIVLFQRRHNQAVLARQKLANVTLQNSRLKEEKLQLQVRNQSQDLNELSGQVMFIRELNNQISEKLSGIDKLDIKEQKQTLLDLAHLSKRNLQEIEIKGILQENLQKINSHFYRQLEELSNNQISKGEKEIAAMLRLNLSDTQISDLRGTSLSAVRVSRHRIKQKLGVEKGKDLSQFLSSF